MSHCINHHHFHCHHLQLQQQTKTKTLSSRAQWRMLLVGEPSFQTTSLGPLLFSYPRHRRGQQCCRCCLNCDEDCTPCLLYILGPYCEPAACDITIPIFPIFPVLHILPILIILYHDHDVQVVDVPLIENRQCEQWHSRRGITVRI